MTRLGVRVLAALAAAFLVAAIACWFIGVWNPVPDGLEGAKADGRWIDSGGLLLLSAVISGFGAWALWMVDRS